MLSSFIMQYLTPFGKNKLSPNISGTRETKHETPGKIQNWIQLNITGLLVFSIWYY